MSSSNVLAKGSPYESAIQYKDLVVRNSAQFWFDEESLLPLVLLHRNEVINLHDSSISLARYVRSCVVRTFWSKLELYFSSYGCVER